MGPGLIFALIYGVLSIVGGIIGYRQAGSKVSLISGIVSGLLLLLAVVLMARWLAIVVSLVLVIVFVTRLLKTKKFMPAGLMVIVGVATLMALLFA
ncbi:MAG: TMEM14 family protein [Cyanobacteria bacterium P01_G01_bin.38]